MSVLSQSSVTGFYFEDSKCLDVTFHFYMFTDKEVNK